MINLAFYNVENLFEPGHHPQHKDEWTQQLYDKKIANIASVISKINDGNSPHIIGLCEVESNKVVKDIIGHLPNSANYDFQHHDSPDVRMIDVDFIYDKTVFEVVKAEALNIRKRYPTRDIFKVTFKIKANVAILNVIGCHWPSRSGGQYKSEPYRMMVAENTAWLVDQLYDQDANANTIVMGDFNDEPFNRSVQEYLYGIRSKARVQARRNSSRSRPYLYNLNWLLLDEPTPGTFYYSDSPSGWNMMDQIMVSKAVLTGSAKVEVDENSITIYRPKEIRDGSKPLPFRKTRNGWKEGFSDHFPVSVNVKMVED